MHRRIEEAEAETELCKKELSGAQLRCTGLEKDNLGLYERCRYMERCFQTQQASAPATAAYKVVNVDEAGIPHPAVSLVQLHNGSLYRRAFQCA